MAKGCIHFSGSGCGSEIHNLRQKKLSYVRSDLTYENQSFFYDKRAIGQIESELKAKYELTTGKKLRKNAELTQHGVAVMDEGVTLEDLQHFCEEVNAAFGWQPLQIHVHEDEGHYTENKEWIKNRHAHIIFAKRDMDTGLDIHLNKAQYSRIQTLYCDNTRMERGDSSDVTHLSAIEFKIQQRKKELYELTSKLGEVDNLARENKRLNAKLEAYRDAAAKMTAAHTKVKTLIEEQHAAYKRLLDKYNYRTEEIAQLTEENRLLSGEISRLKQENKPQQEQQQPKLRL